MTDAFIRHFVALVGTLLFGVVYWAGYQAGIRGWAFAVLAVLVVYPIIFGIIKAD